MEEEKDISKLLEERVKLDSMLQEKFSKKITIMFTDIKGSTSFYETQGDIDGRVMVHRHNEIVLPLIDRNQGTLLKTIGDATMSFYEKPEEGAQAAVEVQKALSDYNRDRQAKEQIHVRIGLNYGVGIVEKGDVYGDIVNTASRVESLADGGEIMVTEDLYRAVRSHDEFIFRFFKTVEVKGKKEPVRAYRLLWQPEEVCLGKLRKAPDVVTEKDGVFVLDASLSGEKLKVSGVGKSEGEERAAKTYDEINYNIAKVREYTNGITDLLNRANRRGKIGNDLLVKLKEYGRMLFDELIPVQIKEQLVKTEFRHLLISIDDNLVHIPWELLNDGKDFLCQRFCIGRTVSTKQRVSGVVRAIGRPLKMQVIADPRGDLNASYEEGVRIKEEIGQYEDIMDVALKTTDVKTDYVKAKIRNFDLIHYAGHADHDVKNPGRSGWLLKDGRISADEIISMTGVMPMPSLVFSNACQTAQTDEWKIGEDYEHKIFGLANAFLLSGVQHYIGTFWEIPDEAGLHFSLNFYQNLVRGISVGEAMRLARQSLIEKYGEDMIVWASYLLYGDPLAKYVLPEMEARVADAEPAEPRQMPVGAGLRHGADSVAFPQPAKSSSVRNAVIALALVIAAGLGVYFVQTGGGNRETKVVAVSGVPAVAKDDGKRIDELVASFAKDYREGRFDQKKQNRDDWTTPPLTIVFMEIKSDGSSANVEKMTGFLSQQIQETGRASVVEREILVKLLEELKLSGSALADPATALKLGKVLSARLIVTGSVIPDKKTQTVMLRFIDTETTAVKKVISAETAAPEMDKAFISGMGTKIIEFLKADMQVRGKVTGVTNDTCQINLGAAHGLKKGDRVEIVKEARPGSGLFMPVAEIEVAEVGKDSSVAQIAGKKDAVVNGAKIRIKQG